MSGDQKYFAWRYDVWGGGPKQWNVVEHPAGGERRSVWPTSGMAPNHSEKRARARATTMNAAWARYQRAMLAKPSDVA